MSIVTQGQDGLYTHGLEIRSQMYINDSERLLTDSTVASSVAGVLANVLFPGRAVTLEATASGNIGRVRAAKVADTFIYGLTDTENNYYASASTDKTGMYGSGKANVFLMGRAVIRPNVYLAADGVSEVTVMSYDTTLSYLPGDPLYVSADANGDGLLSNAKSVVGTVPIAYVLTPAPTPGTEMEVMIMGGLSASAIV